MLRSQSREELVNEVGALRAELREKSIQIEALNKFEHEFGLKVHDVVQGKDKRIEELEGRVHELANSSTPSLENSSVLLDMLRDRELEVATLEAKVHEIMSERRDRSPRDILTESLVDFEDRVEKLRRELVGKDSEINQLRELLDNTASHTPSPEKKDPPRLSLVGQVVSMSPRPSDPGASLEQIKRLRDKLETAVSALEGSTFTDRTSQFPPEILNSCDAVIEVCMLQVQEYKRAAERYRRELGVLKKALTDPSESNIMLLELENALRSQRIGDVLKDQLQSYKEENDILRRQFYRQALPAPRLVAEEVVQSESGTQTLPTTTTPQPTASTQTPVNSEVGIVAVPPLPVRSGSIVSTARIQISASDTHQEAIDAMAKRLREELNNRRAIEDQNERLEDNARTGLAKVAELELQVAKLKAENTELVRAMTVSVASESMVRGLGDLKEELQAKDQEVRTIRDKLTEARKEMKKFDQEKEELESEHRKMQRTIDSLRAVKKAVPVTDVPVAPSRGDVRLKAELDKLKHEIVAMKRPSVASPVRNVETSKPVKAFERLNVVVTETVLMSAVACEQPTVSRFQAETLLQLQAQLADTEEQLFATTKRLNVDAKMELELSLLQKARLESESIDLRAKVADLEFQLRQRVGSHELARTDDAVLRAQLEVRRTTAELETVRRNTCEQEIDNIRLKNTILDLECDKTNLARRTQRAVEQRDLIQAELLAMKAAHAKPSKPDVSPVKQTVAASDEVKTLREANQRLLAEKHDRQQSARRDALELEHLRNQREQDKAALAEAERVLALVDQTEAKYVKVAKENAKLRKDISALNDDAFWNDLENLQNQHKDSLDLLKACRRCVTDRVLLRRMEALVGPSDHLA